MRLFVKLLGAAVAALMCVGTLQLAPASAATVARVATPTVAQNWYAAKLTVRWRAVTGASYQVRWATVKTMRYAKVKRVATRSLAIGPLNRSKPWFVQVRAIKAGKVGAWSPTTRAAFRNKWPSAANPTATGIPGGVKVSWPYAAYATGYRVKFAAAPYDNWPAATKWSPWLGIGARSRSYQVPTNAATDTTLTAVPFGNAIYTQVLTRSAYHRAAAPKSKWRAAFPSPPTPAPGAKLRIGTYNVALGGHGADKDTDNMADWAIRLPKIAQNIADNGLTMVSLQEIFSNCRPWPAPCDNTTGADGIVNRLRSITGNKAWQVAEVSQATEARVIYDATKWRLVNSGPLSDYGTVINPRSGREIVVPWSTFQSTDPASTRRFVVVPAHIAFADSSGALQAANNVRSGLYARQLMAATDAMNARQNPNGAAVIMAGDYTVNNELWGDPSSAVNAHATLVKAGYYNAMAATRKVGYQWATGNKLIHPQPVAPSGVGPRPDAIYLKGIVGSNYYRNVANYTGGLAKPPSDHNLVVAEVQVPN